ncbi:hypothetical protein D3C84_1178490 [compost metagenome]
MMVVPVLITSCQVSLKPKSGPLTIQASTTATATAKTGGRPEKRAAALAKRVYQSKRFMACSNEKRLASH